MPSATSDKPDIGNLVVVRGQRWVVGDVDPAEGNTIVTLQSVEDGRYGESLTVVWEIEPGREVLPSGSLPEVTPNGFDRPERLAAFLDAIRWSAVASADVRTLQAPFRSGVAVEDYQLEPVARAVDSPRVNLLLADDVGLGKTIEAGLVALELMLRQRGRRIMIVCPAGLTIKWKDEMAEKFGLDFTIIDTDRCAKVRRAYGSAANPFEIYPLTIVSLPWLRGQKAQRLLAEVLPPDGPTYPRTFDLLILDEAHHIAPAAPKQAYAVDSQQTKLIRRLAPHFTHRLFLSATPHNGYNESFTALLEILDDQRFARGVQPSRSAVSETVVRRLKTQILENGRPKFPKRVAKEIPVEYPPDEREVHDLLKQFAALRRKRLTKARGRKAADLVTLLLKKRLFSSPAAFARTVDVYLGTIEQKVENFTDSDDVPEWLEDFVDDVADYDDEGMANAEDDAVVQAHPLQGGATPEEAELLKRMWEWAERRKVRPDAKAAELITYLKAVCLPDGKNWTNERVVVFTEYKDTLDWLETLLRQEGLGGDRVATMHGGKSADEREQVRLAFQKAPDEHPVRILLATDAAGEGIDLQRYCHRLVNYDIPFNPNKLEQRIGRIDRYGQRQTPEVRHFVGVFKGEHVDTYEADLEFLARVARKVAQQEKDLGPVNAVISERVQRRMLGENVSIDNVEAETPEENLPLEHDVPEQVRRLRERIDRTVDELGITPANVKRVVDTALELARQQPLRPYVDERHHAEGLWEVPVLTGSWERGTEGLLEKFNPDKNETPRRRPITFDPAATKDPEGRVRDDVVLAHLNHPLVAMSTGLLRAAVSNKEIGLNRVTAVVSDHPKLETTLVGAYSRFVLVGGDGVLLHEEVLYAGGWLRERHPGFARVETLGTLRDILGHALSGCVPASPRVQTWLAEDAWPRARKGLLDAVNARAAERQDSLMSLLEKRKEAERKRIRSNIEEFRRTLEAKLAEDTEDDGALIKRSELKDPRELAQYQRDRQSWQDRLDRLESDLERELEVIERRYSDPRPHLFPVALIFVVPRHEAAYR
ncbi:helicase SNF2 family protein [Thermopolyspora flexuosa]|uniref:SNF2 domain-containing protein n=1 Tax=Thermopolyspora flexuosa TaxID=103836 RepID=A0A543IX43_9ACTN|nr:DISARM system SNF2-like helicase DrmD [Thermopolyspora flexuosa]TQM75127.1 SNF2 domain-containing protein [Thermopolyspora flexuosa]GGM91970.1 helicase SNF2 family protein [Thermopolyspora flexuosa]